MTLIIQCRHNTVFNLNTTASSSSSLQRTKYTKIVTSCWAYIPIICTLGLFTLIQTYRFQNALSSGDVETAKNALLLGAVKYTTINKILKLAHTNQIESIKLLVAQINIFNKKQGHGNRIFNPDRLPYSVEAFISARDDHQEGQNKTLLEILPNEVIDRTVSYDVYAENYGGKNDVQSHDFLGTERVYSHGFRESQSKWYGHSTVFYRTFL